MNAVTEAWPVESAPRAADAEPVRVAVAGDADARDWQAWIERHPQATIYHDWAWRGILAKAFGHRPHFLVARRGGRMVGVLPLAQVQTLLFGHSLVSLLCPARGPAGRPRNTRRVDPRRGAGPRTRRRSPTTQPGRVASRPSRRKLQWCSKPMSADHEAT